MNIDDPLLQGATLYRDVERYVAFGVHRSGTPGDRATAAWLADELERAGYGLDWLDFELETPVVGDCRLVLSQSEALDVFPKWPILAPPPSPPAPPASAPAPPASAITGALARWPCPGGAAADRIVVMDLTLDQSPVGLRADLAQAAAQGARAVMLITHGVSGELVAQNTPLDAPMDPLPVALVAPKHADILDRASVRGDAATLVMEVEIAAAQVARSPIAIRPGISDRWLVVVTPHSGWFTCGGERGPGIAIWLALARWAAKWVPRHHLLFMAGSGHELGMVAENRFIRERAPSPTLVDLWLHLGASIATRAWRESPERELGAGLDGPDVPERSGELVADPPILEGILTHLGDYAGYPSARTVSSFVETLQHQARADRQAQRPAAELPELMRFAYFTAVDAGYRPSLGLFGHHAYFHTPLDGAASTSPELLEPVARALARVISEI